VHLKHSHHAVTCSDLTIHASKPCGNHSQHLSSPKHHAGARTCQNIYHSLPQTGKQPHTHIEWTFLNIFSHNSSQLLNILSSITLLHQCLRPSTIKPTRTPAKRSNSNCIRFLIFLNDLSYWTVRQKLSGINSFTFPNLTVHLRFRFLIYRVQGTLCCHSWTTSSCTCTNLLSV
jgi:hypothetical protein